MSVVLISGAAGGLGAALAQNYLARGDQVVAMDRDAQRLGPATPDYLPLVADVTDVAAVQAAVRQAVAQFGGLDTVICNAGITHRSLLSETDAAVIRRVMEVNFFGAANLTQAALPHLLVRNGRIAAISSVAGFAPLIGRTGYAASKHALHGFFDSLRSEVEPLGVSVTLVCPSFIATGISQAALGAAPSGGAAGPRVTTGAISSPEAIAARIAAAVAARKRLLLPDTTSRLAWWFCRLAPRAYAWIMHRRLSQEFFASGDKP